MTPWLRVLVLVAAVPVTSALDNGLALTPPMGWLSWERFRCNMNCAKDPDSCISEKLYMQMADVMVTGGFKDAGYQYVNVDDCWQAKERDPNGKLMPDPVRFPHGMKALGDYIHGKGLKFGIYSDFGSRTCGGFPGSEYFMETDANTFAEWGVDFLKMDGCNCDPKDMPYGFPAMGKFLNMTGRPIMYDCEWPLYFAQPDMHAVRASCNLWRMSGDITDSWESVTKIITSIGQRNKSLKPWVGPGGWADPDMLLVGDYGLSYYQQRVQFGMWAMFSAPLLMSNDLRSISDEGKAILLNKNVIAISQDPLGDMASQVLAIPTKDISEPGSSVLVWTKQLARPAHGSVAVGIVGPWTNGDTADIQTSLGAMGLTNPEGYNLTDAWENKALGQFGIKQNFTVTVYPSSLQLWIATPMS